MRLSNDELTSVSDRSYAMGYLQALDDLESTVRKVEKILEGKEKGTFISAAAFLEDVDRIRKEFKEKLENPETEEPAEMPEVAADET